MSFATELSTIMNSDSTLNGLVENRIYADNIPDNLHPSKDAIVYNHRLSENEDCLDGKSLLEYHDLFVIVLSHNTENIDTIMAAIRALLDEYENDYFRDFLFNGNTQSLDGEKERYIRSLDYRITYKHN